MTEIFRLSSEKKIPDDLCSCVVSHCGLFNNLWLILVSPLTHSGPFTRQLVTAIAVFGLSTSWHMLFSVADVFLVTPYFFCPGKSKNCSATAVIGRKLSQSTSLAGVSSMHHKSESWEIRGMWVQSVLRYVPSAVSSFSMSSLAPPQVSRTCWRGVKH